MLSLILIVPELVGLNVVFVVVVVTGCQEPNTCASSEPASDRDTTVTKPRCVLIGCLLSARLVSAAARDETAYFSFH